jgi:hypothetical protein
MAMPIPNELANPPSRDGRLGDRTEQPASGTRARRPQAAARPAPAPSARPDPEQEAILLMSKVVERVEVATAFAKLASGLLAVTAARAAAQLKAVADQKIGEAMEREGGLGAHYARAVTIARAAKGAAVHVATHRSERAAPEATTPVPSEAPETGA